VELSRHLAPAEVTTGDMAVKVQSQTQADIVRMTMSFPADFVLPAGFRGVDKPGGDQPGWLSWPISRVTAPVFIHCRPQTQAPGRLRARLLREGQPGPWTELKAVVLPPLPAPPRTEARHLGLSLWEGGSMAAGGPQGQAALVNMLKQYQQVGLKRLHIGRPRRCSGPPGNWACTPT